MVTASTDSPMWAAVAIGLDGDDDPRAELARMLWVLDDFEAIARDLETPLRSD